MLVINEKDIPVETFSAHDGEGEMHARFAFKQYARFGNKNDSGWRFFGIVEFPVGTTAGLHLHEGDDEFFYILDGEAVIVQDGEERTVTQGDIVLTRCGSTHGIVRVLRPLKLITLEILRTDKDQANAQIVGVKPQDKNV